MVVWVTSTYAISAITNKIVHSIQPYKTIEREIVGPRSLVFL